METKITECKCFHKGLGALISKDCPVHGEPTQKVERIEKLDTNTADYINLIENKINEIIDAVNSLLPKER